MAGPLSRRLPALWATAAAFLAAAGSLGVILSPPPRIAQPPLRPAVLSALAVGTRESVVTTRRRGHVTALRSSQGATVAAGDPLVELVDVGLGEAKAELDRKIAGLRGAEDSAQSKADVVRSERRDLRQAALRQLEESYESAREDFERWKALNEGGLVARLEFRKKEQEFAELGQRLAEARALAEQAEQDRNEPVAKRESPELRRAERLRARLDRLPGTFVVTSPWDGTVGEIHVAVGAATPRGAALVTLVRTALPRLEASTGDLGAVMMVRSACGVPGPLPFTVREGVLGLASPDASIRPGHRCEVVVWTRGRRPMGN
ncbi:MAG: hypothetical protein OXN97_21915 [Bryobacterales bacterium]|nr:hypothetical protein [Bryobacterales bacterium]